MPLFDLVSPSSFPDSCFFRRIGRGSDFPGLQLSHLACVVKLLDLRSLNRAARHTSFWWLARSSQPGLQGKAGLLSIAWRAPHSEAGFRAI